MSKPASPAGPRAKGALGRARELFAFRRGYRWLRERLWGAEAIAAAAWLDNAVSLAAKEPAPSEGGLMVSFLVPLEGAPLASLDRLVASFRRQRGGLGELLLCETTSTNPAMRAWAARQERWGGIRRVAAADGTGAALDAGRQAARAPWVARLDPDGALAPHALDRIARALGDFANGLCLYTDEVLTDAASRPRRAVTKPAWDPVLITGMDYLGRLALFRREALMDIGGWGADGAEHDLARRLLAGARPEQVRHLPYPAYLRRETSATPGSAIPDRPDWARARRDWPRVSVIIPSRDAPELIGQVLDGVLRRTDYPDLEIVVVDNGSTDPRTLALYSEHAADPRLRVDLEPADFNFSRAVNKGAALATGEWLLLLNNDIEIERPDWLREMVSCFHPPDVGIVGAKLLYPDRRLQHAGVIAGLGGYAGHWFIGEREDIPGPMNRLRARQSLSVVTGACMLISRACWRAVGSFDEEVFPIAYNDVDYCLRATGAGFRVVWTPFATLIHHESASRGSDETPENIARFDRDKAALVARHRTDILEDRAYSPWYSRHDSIPRIGNRNDLPAPR